MEAAISDFIALPSFLGTFPQWLTAGGVCTLIGMFLRYHLGLRKLGGDEAADIRDHYKDEVTALRQEMDLRAQRVRQHMDEMEARYKRMLDESEDRCKERLDAKVLRINKLEDDVKGLIRIIVQNSANNALSLGDDLPDDIREAAIRIIGRAK